MIGKGSAYMKEMNAIGGMAALLLGAAVSLSHGAELKLTLSAQANIVRLGDIAHCVLVLDGDLVRDIPKGTKDAVIPGDDGPFGFGKGQGRFDTRNTFRYEFTVKPSKEGPVRIGPYSVNFAGHELVSNDIELRVLPADQEGRGLKASFDKTSVRVGEPVTMLAEYWNASKPAEESGTGLKRQTAGASLHSSRATRTLRLLPSPAFSVQALGGGGSMGRGLEMMREHYQLTPRQPGRFSFTEKDFEGLPEGTKVTSQALEVK